jgi:cell division protease FtsH
MLARIRTLLGGRAAEVLCYGNEAGLTTGAAGDLEAATNAARQMICRYGMDDEFGPVATPELLQYREAVGSAAYERVTESARKVLKHEMARTMKLLQENHNHLDAVARALVEKNRLVRADLGRILPVKRLSDLPVR